MRTVRPGPYSMQLLCFQATESIKKGQVTRVRHYLLNLYWAIAPGGAYYSVEIAQVYSTHATDSRAFATIDKFSFSLKRCNEYIVTVQII